MVDRQRTVVDRQCSVVDRRYVVVDRQFGVQAVCGCMVDRKSGQCVCVSWTSSGCGGACKNSRNGYACFSDNL